MRVWAARTEICVRGEDTGPDGGEWEEDADQSQDLGTEFGEFVIKLEDGEDGFWLLAW